MRSSKKSNDKSQLDKFKDIAREVDADEDEQAFDDKLRPRITPPFAPAAHTSASGAR